LPITGNLFPFSFHGTFLLLFCGTTNAAGKSEQ
jgi:hypothetical protein